MKLETFITEYKAIIGDLQEILNKSIQKNVSKADEIVNSYLKEAKNGNYSIKSYKAKIIRNEQDHQQNDNLVSIDVQNSLDKIKESLEKLDGNILNINSKKDNHGIEDNLSTNDSDLNKNLELQKEYLLLKNNINTKYEDDLKKILKRKEENEKTIRSLLLSKLEHEKVDLEDRIYASELELLSTDDLNRIKELKKQISKEREINIDKVFAIKKDTSRNIKETEDSFYEKKYKISTDYINAICDVNEKLLQTQYDITLSKLKIEEETILNSVKVADEYLKSTNLLIDSLKERIVSQNKSLLNEEIKKSHYPLYIVINHFDYLYLELLRKNKNYEILSYLQKINIEINDVITTYDNLFSNLNNKKEIQIEKLNDVLKDFYPKDPRDTKESFTTNVTSSLDRFYQNLFAQLEFVLSLIYKLYQDYYQMIVNKINHFLDEKVNTIFDNNNKIINTQIVYNKYHLNGYNVVDKTNFDENIIESINKDCIQYYTDYQREIEKKKEEFELVVFERKENNKSKLYAIQEKFAQDLKKIKINNEQKIKEYNNQLTSEKQQSQEKMNNLIKIASEKMTNSKKYL